LLKQLNYNLNFLKVKEFINLIYNFFFKYINFILVKQDSFFLNLKDNLFLIFFFFLKNSIFFNFSQLMDIIIVDKLELNLLEGKRFNFFYVFLSIFNNFRIYISGFLGLFEVLPSITSLFLSAD